MGVREWDEISKRWGMQEAAWVLDMRWRERWSSLQPGKTRVDSDRASPHQVTVAADDSDDAGDIPPAQRARPPPGLPEPPRACCQGAPARTQAAAGAEKRGVRSGRR